MLQQDLQAAWGMQMTLHALQTHDANQTASR